MSYNRIKKFPEQYHVIQKKSKTNISGSMTDRVGKFCKPLSNDLCNKQLAFGILQLV